MSTPAVDRRRIDVRGVAERILAGIVHYWETEGWPLPIDSSGQLVTYLAAGDPNAVADDGPALVVSLMEITSTASQAKGMGAGAPPRATFVVRLMRRTPILEDESAPSPDEIAANAAELLEDPGRLMEALIAWSRDEPVTTSLNGSREVGPLRPEGPMGDTVGHSVQVSVSPVQ